MRQIVTFCVFAGLLTGQVLAQVPRGDAEATVGGKSIKVEYGRPSLNGRDMLGRARVGDVWRMGADSATSLATQAELKFGNAVVPAGTYVLRARKEESGWTLLISDADTSHNVAEVLMETGAPGEPVETFTIELKADGGSAGVFSMAWGSMRASARFTAG